jgi:hypothetical protein
MYEEKVSSDDKPLRRAITLVNTNTDGGNGDERTVPSPLVSVRFVGVRLPLFPPYRGEVFPPYRGEVSSKTTHTIPRRPEKKRDAGVSRHEVVLHALGNSLHNSAASAASASLR